MKRKSIRLIFLMIGFVCLCGFNSVYAKASERKKILAACEKIFGESIDEKLHLFEVNRFYVLQAEFSNRGSLIELSVNPKYFFDDVHPDWEEPDNFAYLTYTDFKNLLPKLDVIKPKGLLVKKIPFSVTLNMTDWITEIYQNASLTRGVISEIGNDEIPSEIKGFEIQYGKRNVINRSNLKFDKLF